MLYDVFSKGLASYCKAETTFTFHFSILTLSNAFLGIDNREMKSESGFSFAIASQPLVYMDFYCGAKGHSFCRFYKLVTSHYSHLPDCLIKWTASQQSASKTVGQCSALTDQPFKCVNKLRPSSASVIALILIKSIFPHSTFTTV